MRRVSIIFFLACATLPLGAGFLYALLYSFGMVGALAQGVSMDAWRSTLSYRTFWVSMGVSMLLATTVVIFAVTIALGLLVRWLPQLAQPRVRFLLHFPLALPPLVAAFVSFQWLGNSGMLARAAFHAGFVDSPDAFPPLINDPLYFGVGFTMTMTTFPFLLLIFLEQYQSTNLRQISDLAATLGASAAQIRRRVVAPVLLRRAAPTLLLYGVFLFGAYEVPLLLGRQNPAMISMFINQKFSRFNLADLPLAYVATVVYAILVMLLVVVFLHLSRKAQLLK